MPIGRWLREGKFDFDAALPAEVRGGFRLAKTGSST